jgi:hypothetical protein
LNSSSPEVEPAALPRRILAPSSVTPPVADRLPLERLKVVPLATVTLLAESDAFEVWVTVTPLMLSSASSDEVGTW